jgi:hypothetical protein
MVQSISILDIFQTNIYQIFMKTIKTTRVYTRYTMGRSAMRHEKKTDVELLGHER